MDPLDLVDAMNIVGEVISVAATLREGLMPNVCGINQRYIYKQVLDA